MNKFETRLLETLSSIDESLKAIAAGRAVPAKKPVGKVPAKAAVKPVKKVKPVANGALPKVVAKAVDAIAKGVS